MTYLTRTLKSLFLALLLIVVFAFSAFAEEPESETEFIPAPPPVPVAVKDLKVTLSGTTAALSWNPVENAVSYKVSLVDKTTGNILDLLADNYKKQTFTVKDLKQALTYSFMVQGISKEGILGPNGKIVSVTVPAPKPAAPKKFKQVSMTATSVKFDWAKVSGISGYTIFVKKAGETSFTPAKNYKKTVTAAKLSNFPTNTTYEFYIKSYRNVNGVKVYSKQSSTVKVKLDSLAAQLKKIRVPRYRVTAQRDLIGKDNTTGKKVVIKQGTKFTVNSRAKTSIIAYLSNGKVVALQRSGITYRSLDSSKKNDYSKDLKELFVNSRNYGSSTGWFIWVSEYKLKTNVFKGSRGKWKLVKEFPCVVGAYNHRTTAGMHNILKKVYNGKYGSPMFWFTVGPGSKSNPAGCAFHQYVDGTRNAAASHGCIRMDTSALYFMYNCIPTGTPVYIH